MRRDRVTAILALALLQVFTVVASVVVVILTPGFGSVRQIAEPVRRAPLRPAAVLSEAGPGTRTPSPSGVAARLRAPMAARALGPSVSAVVLDTATGRTLYQRRADEASTPASTTKIITGVAALAELGPDHRISTTVVTGTRKDEVILVGGGDPTLTTRTTSRKTYPRPATLTSLARSTATALKRAGRTRIRLGYDVSRFQGPTLGPGWKPSYVTEGSVAPVVALETDGGRLDPRGRARTQDPAGRAAAQFAYELRRAGITVTGDPREMRAPADARELARVSSPPMSALVERMLTDSDNDVAEALARRIAIKQGKEPSFAGGSAAVREALGRLGLGSGVAVYDGSGLSRNNKITSRAMVKVLAAAASDRHPELRPVLTGLPIGGFTGTLTDRYGDGGAAAGGAGYVRGKTGTLNGVSTLAGVVQDADGRLLAFAFMADKVGSNLAAEGALDRLAATIAGCGCP